MYKKILITFFAFLFSISKAYSFQLENKSNVVSNKVNSFESLLSKGISYYHINKNEKSLLYLNKAYKIKPRNTKVLFYKSYINLLNNNFKELDKDLNTVLNLKKTKFDNDLINEFRLVIVKKYNNLLTKRLNVDLIKFVKENRSKTNDIVLINIVKVLIKIETKNFDEALLYINNIIKTLPDSIEMYKIRSSINLFKNRNKEALKDINLYINHIEKNNSVYWQPYQIRGEVYYNIGISKKENIFLKKSINNLEKAIDLNENDYRNYFLISLPYYKLKDYRMSFLSSLVSLSLNYNIDTLNYFKPRLYNFILNENSNEIKVILNDLYEAFQDNEGKALDFFIVSLMVNFKDLQKKLPEIGEKYYKEKKYSKSLEQFKKFSILIDLMIPYFQKQKNKDLVDRLNIGKAFSKMNLGKCYLKKGTNILASSNFDESIKIFNNIVKSKPNHTYSLYYLARIYSIRLEKEKAYYFLKKAIKLDNSLKKDALKNIDLINIRNEKKVVKLLLD